MPRTFIAVVGDEQLTVTEERLRAGLPGMPGQLETLPSMPGSTLVSLLHDGRRRRAWVRTLPDGSAEVWIGRFRVVVSLQDERHRRLSSFIRGGLTAATGISVKAPMPGLIKEIAVRRGDAVKSGQRLLTLEAMKMENEIAAPIDGTVDDCRLEPGVSVDKGEELLHITPHSED